MIVNIIAFLVAAITAIASYTLFRSKQAMRQEIKELQREISYQQIDVASHIQRCEVLEKRLAEVRKPKKNRPVVVVTKQHPSLRVFNAYEVRGGDKDWFVLLDAQGEIAFSCHAQDLVEYYPK